MQLHYSPASPYVRKVLVLAIETGLNDRIERVTRVLTPTNPNEALNRDNPLGKLPALVVDDATVLFDSRVICEYLDTLHDRTALFPQGTTRWAVLRRQAIGDGILDAAVSTRYETFLRPETLVWPDWVAGQRAKIERSVALLAKELEGFQNGLDIGVITIACALGYLDFRFDDLDWRSDHPHLAAWYAAFAERASMQETIPQ